MWPLLTHHLPNSKDADRPIHKFFNAWDGEALDSKDFRRATQTPEEKHVWTTETHPNATRVDLTGW